MKNGNGRGRLSFEVVAVTPQLAREWLSDLDPKQRQVRENVVRQYARDMIAGAWRLTHQPIAFDVEGKLIDGQHRLHAVVESEQTVEMTVARNIEGDYTLPIDVGFRRTPRDLLHLPNQTIAATGVLRKLQRGTVRHQVSASRASIEELRETYDKYQQDVDAGCLIVGKGLATASCAGAIAFARPIASEKIDEFVASVKNGANLEPNSPALQLRNWFMRHSGRTRTSVDGVMATLAAANAELRGVPVGVLHTSPNGYEALCSKRRAMHILDTPSVRTGRFSGEARATMAVQPRVLALLRAGGEMEYSDICDEIGERKATVSDALYKLKQKELVHSPSLRRWAAVPIDIENNLGDDG